MIDETDNSIISLPDQINFMISPYLVVAPSPKGGRGIFTTKKIPSGTTIEISPVLVLTTKDRKVVEQTLLHNYIFEWGKSRRQACVGLGYISLYNHDYSANCIYEMDYDYQTMSIITIRPVEKGEELFLNYNAAPDDETPLWFNAK